MAVLHMPFSTRELYDNESWQWTETALRCFRLGATCRVDVAETAREHVLNHVTEHWKALHGENTAHLLSHHTDYI